MPVSLSPRVKRLVAEGSADATRAMQALLDSWELAGEACDPAAMCVGDGISNHEPQAVLVAGNQFHLAHVD